MNEPLCTCRFSPDKAGDPLTEDFYHVLECYRYVKSLKYVLFDFDRIALAGNSRGGYSAVSLATITTFATHAMCIHSNFLWQQARLFRPRPHCLSEGFECFAPTLQFLTSAFVHL